MHSSFPLARRANGGHIVIRLVISTITLLCIGGLIYYLLHMQQQTHARSMRKALEISEYGLFTALQSFQQDTALHKTIPRTPYGEGWYEVVVSTDTLRDTVFLSFASTGTCKTISQTKKCVLFQVPASGNLQWINKGIL